jgi:hypothetical protein
MDIEKNAFAADASCHYWKPDHIETAALRLIFGKRTILYPLIGRIPNNRCNDGETR